MKTVVRRCGFALLMAGLVYLTLEVVSFFSYGLLTGERFSFAAVEDERKRARRDSTGRTDVGVEPDGPGEIPPWQVIHPYLGYVMTPSPKSDFINRYGFEGPPPPFKPLPRNFDRKVVGVFGGSVAERMVNSAKGVLGRMLSDNPCFAGHPIDVINFALPGVKQPQQLMTLNYFLSLGAHLDLVISLDGFNEVALPVAENERQGVFPIYPRSWRHQVAGVADVKLMREVGQIEFWRGMRKQSARRVSRSLLRYSSTANLFWLLGDRAMQRKVGDLQLALSFNQARAGKGAVGYHASGPEQRYANDRERFRDLAGIWSRSTRLMHDLAEGSGIPSFHFLQPHQHVVGSKTFSPAERAVAIGGGHVYADPARRGYPYLIRAGEHLRKSGVPLIDLTMMFKDVAEPLYMDACCHVNKRGSRLIAREIGRVVNASLTRSCREATDAVDAGEASN